MVGLNIGIAPGEEDDNAELTSVRFSPKVDVNNADAIPQSSYLESFRQTIEQVDVIHSLCRRYPDTFGFADSSASVWSAFRAGRVASLIGVEGLHQTANSLSALRMLHRLGVRYVTLSHNCNNEHADAAVRDDDPCCPFGWSKRLTCQLCRRRRRSAIEVSPCSGRRCCVR